MSIVASCRCGKRFAAEPRLAGKQVQCPACGQVLRVPAAQGPAQETPLPSPGADPNLYPPGYAPPAAPSEAQAPAPPRRPQERPLPSPSDDADRFPPNWQPAAEQTPPPRPPSPLAPNPVAPNPVAPAQTSGMPRQSATPAQAGHSELPPAPASAPPDVPLDQLVSLERTSAPAPYVYGTSPDFHPRPRRRRGNPALLVGCLSTGAALALLLVVGVVVGLMYFLPQLNKHPVGYVQHASRALTPLTSFKAGQEYRLNRNYPALYYYYDDDGRKFLDGLARKYDLDDGIALLEQLYGPRGETVEVNQETKEKYAEMGERLAEWAEEAMGDIEYTEEVNGNRGAVLMHLGNFDVTVRFEMVRVAGVWHQSLSARERAEIQRLAAQRRGGVWRGGFP